MGKGFDTFMANPYWRRVYEEAPSEELKEYYRLRFDISRFVMGEDHRDAEAEDRLEKLPLAKSDIEYIQKHAGSGMAKSYYEKFIRKLTVRNISVEGMEGGLLDTQDVGEISES